MWIHKIDRPHAWQEDRGIGRSYGYNRNETEAHYNTRKQLLHMLTKVAGNGGNLLLCVGPKADGAIPELQRRRLLEMGAWLDANGESIYGSTASPFWPRKFAWGTCTAKPGRIYLHVWDSQTTRIELPGLTNNVLAAYLLADKTRRPLAVRRNERAVTIELPERLPDPDVTVVAVEIELKPAAK